MKIILTVVLRILSGVILSLLLFALYWYVRPGSAAVNRDMVKDVGEVKTSDDHNAFTDMVCWRGSCYLTFRTAPDHESPEGARIRIFSSQKGSPWKEAAVLSRRGKDIRDPKFALIKNRLFIYTVSADRIDDPSTTTFYSWTSNGGDWQPLKPLKPENKRLWRPKTLDGKTWYCPVFRDFRVDLYRTADGINWKFVSTIHDTEGADETAIEFLPDGRIIASMRLQSVGLIGNRNRGTLIATAEAPYIKWQKNRTMINRLDGPCLFRLKDRVLALGRYQPETDFFVQQMGSIFTRKRTALFLLTEKSLRHLTDLPSAGDTSYPAAVVERDRIRISFYSSDPERDYPWVYGFFLPTKVYTGKLDIKSLEKVISGLEKGEDSSSLPWMDYGVFILLVIFSVTAAFKVGVKRE